MIKEKHLPSLQGMFPSWITSCSKDGEPNTTVISQILQDKKKVKLGKISPTRDFNFIEDTISGFISALNAVNDYGEVINIGSNFEISIEDSVNIIANILNKEISIDTEAVPVILFKLPPADAVKVKLEDVDPGAPVNEVVLTLQVIPLAVTLDGRVTVISFT